ncbi:MAG: Tol-Pal system protein TolB, partial [Pseudomonadota bacterium]
MSLKHLAAAALTAALATLGPAPAAAQEPLRIEITEGVIEPMPIALPRIQASPDAAVLAEEVRNVVISDLSGSGLFRIIDEAAYLSDGGSVDA